MCEKFYKKIVTKNDASEFLYELWSSQEMVDICNCKDLSFQDTIKIKELADLIEEIAKRFDTDNN